MTASRLLFLLVCLSTLVSHPVRAQFDGTVRKNLLTGASTDGGMYMIILDANGRKVPGSLDEKEKPGYIAISAFTQVSETGPEGQGIQHGQVRISKSVGESSAILMEALSENQVLRQVDVLVYTKTADGKESEEFRLRLEKVRVVSMGTRIKAGNPRLPNSTQVEEDLILDYESITWLYDDGTSSYRTEKP